jgi:hypothetical protein
MAHCVTELLRPTSSHPDRTAVPKIRFRVISIILKGVTSCCSLIPIYCI